MRMGGVDHGQGRAQHVVALTRRDELHFVDGLCVAVRCRASGEWLLTHPVCRARLRGCQPLDGGPAWPALVRVGTALVLEQPDGAEFCSNEVFAVESPGATQSAAVLAAARQARAVATRARDARAPLLALGALSGVLGWSLLRPR